MLGLIPMLLLSMIVGADPAAAKGVAPAPVQRYERLVFERTTSLMQARKAAALLPPVFKTLRASHEHRGYRAIDVRPEMAGPYAAATAGVAVPNATGRGVTTPDPNVFGFPGLSDYDQATGGTGIYADTQYDLEPPDQGLCVGNGWVLAPINAAIAAYTQYGQNVTGSVPLSAFFGVAPEEVGTAGPFGPFLADPRCYFDRDTQRWFVTELEFTTNPSTGNDSGPSALLIAVSQTASPIGAFNVFSIDTTDYSHPGCPCFGDQPLIGADNNGFYVSTNEFSVFNPTVNGAQLYGFSKVALALGSLPTVVHLDVGALPTPDTGGQWFSVHPAQSPGLHRGQTANGGTEYLVSSLDFFGKNDDRIALWSLTNTASLANPTPVLGLSKTILRSEAYGDPPPVTQKEGEKPLGQKLKEPEELLDPDDDRMNQVVYAAGRLWTGVNTIARVDGRVRGATAYFVIKPTGTPAVTAQGYVAVAGENTLYPSIGVTLDGKAILTCTLAGTDYYPSAVYVPLGSANLPVRLAAAGLLPDDGFTGYAAFGGYGVGRWGDYTASVVDEYGNLWFAAEYINDSPRTFYANWDTYIGAVPEF